MDEEELLFRAKYPFTKDAKEYVASMDVKLAELDDHPVYADAVTQGRMRLLDALNGVVNPYLSSAEEMELTILSYAVARILANLTKKDYLRKRFAQSEAENAYEYIREDDDRKVGRLMDDVGLVIEEDKIRFTDYILYAAEISGRDPRWKLVNRNVDRGCLLIQKPEHLILLREAIRARVAEPLTLKHPPKFLKKIAEEISASASAETHTSVNVDDEEALPPCIRHMLGLLSMGEVSHNVMFIVATYFVGAGLSVDEVVERFKINPNFDDSRTRYQLKFISGESGGTRYRCPGCTKIKSYGLCKADCGIKHPLSYRKGMGGG